MNQDRIRLIELFLDDALDIRETEQVFHLLGSDSEFRDELARALRMRGLTEGALHPDGRAAELARRVGLAIGGSRGTESFESRVMAALGTRRAARRSRRIWPRPESPALSLWIASAVTAAGFLLILALTTRETSHVPSAPVVRRTPVEGPRRRTLEELADLESKRRRDMETRLGELERSRRRLTDPGPAAPEQKERQNAIMRLDEERRAIEQDLADAVQRERGIREDLAVPPPPVPPPAPPAMTEVAAAFVDRVEGTTHPPLQPGQPLLAGQGVETSGSASAVALKYADDTRLELAGDTKVRELFDRNGKPGRGKRLFVLQGAVSTVVSKQPPDQPMTITTPQSEIKVVGTSLRIMVDAVATRVEVTEGKVRMTRLKDRRMVEIASGYCAVAASGGDFVAQPILPDTPALAQLMTGTLTIDFGPEDIPVPAGTFVDSGRVFDPKRGYGWQDERATRGPYVGLPRAGITDPLRQTAVVVGSADVTEVWKMPVPNGRYLVKVCVGDVRFDVGPCHVAVEKWQVINAAMVKPGTFPDTGEVPIEVKDGELTVKVGGHRSRATASDGTSDTTLCYLTVRRVPARK